jgi:hypothetical protein
MFKFQKHYFFIALILFFTEIIIALYFHDEIIRPYGGDFLVVILLYCLVKAFINTKVRATALAVLLFSYLMETLQYFHFVEVIGLNQYALARIIIGTYFTWTDILAYTLGILLVIAIEKK